MHWSSCHALRSIVRRTSREATRPDHELPDLRTRFVQLPRKGAWQHLQATVERLSQNRGGWRVEEESPDSGQVHLVRGRLMRWCISDVTVSLWRAENGQTVLFAVDVISASRGGPVDFGQNARNIRDFYRVLEATLQDNISWRATCPSPSDTKPSEPPIRRCSKC